MPPTGGAVTGKKRQGRRRKHVPQRTGGVCRETGGKRAHTPSVRRGDGKNEVDPTGPKNGRAGYPCDKQGCWDKALPSSVLAKALRTTPSKEPLTHLQEFAAGQQQDPGDNEPTVDSK